MIIDGISLAQKLSAAERCSALGFQNAAKANKPEGLFVSQQRVSRFPDEGVNLWGGRIPRLWKNKDKPT